MPFAPQRFIHAANVRLDVPVSVHVSEQLTDELRHALEDATLTSFETVIDRCIDLDVDYLLLSGNIFLEADRSLRARIALLTGFRRLDKSGIPVFVIPGDADPPEAWRSIPELPENVTICFAANPEPSYLERDGRPVTAVSASMWYGETDAFGIRVIGKPADGVEPLRIGVVSQAKFEESRRMAALTASGDDELLQAAADDDADHSAVPAEDGLAASHGQHQTTAEYEAEFRSYIEQQMIEGQLKYVAYMGELDRLTISLADGRVHCPGTTQPRSKLEADCGTCSLVELAADGEITISEINTSAVDWKDVSIQVEADDTLNQCLERMKNCLLDLPCSDSDRIWSVRWTVRGPLPVLQSFVEEDLELGVAVELEEMTIAGRKLRIVHEVRTLPDLWEVPDKSSQAQLYADLIAEEKIVSRRRLVNLVREQTELTEGWRQRLESLVAGVDRERIVARMRVDGAHWFVDDLNSLLPDFDDFDEDVLRDEEPETFGLSSDDDADAEQTEGDDADSDVDDAQQSAGDTDNVADENTEENQQAFDKSEDEQDKQSEQPAG